MTYVSTHASTKYMVLHHTILWKAGICGISSCGADDLEGSHQVLSGYGLYDAIRYTWMTPIIRMEVEESLINLINHGIFFWHHSHMSWKKPYSRCEMAIFGGMHLYAHSQTLPCRCKYSHAANFCRCLTRVWSGRIWPIHSGQKQNHR